MKCDQEVMVMKGILSKSGYIRALMFIVSSVFILTVSTLTAQAFVSGDYTYEITDDQATITKYSGSGGDVEIPPTLNGYPVTAIGDVAFAGLSSLTSVAIPDSVTSIEISSLYSCNNLTAISVGSENPNFMSIDGVLFDKTGSTLLLYPAGKTDTTYTIPADVTTINTVAFYHCSFLSSVNIPDSVTSIGDSAFYYSVSLTSVTIPDSVISIGDSAFGFCRNLTSITLPNGLTAINSALFEECRALTNIAIPDSVTSIGNYAFDHCSSLVSVTIPGGVTSIGNYAFASCISLVCVDIADGVTSIGVYAFSSCTNLSSITLPKGLTAISTGLFSECPALTSVTIPDSVTSIGNYAFYRCYNLSNINIPDGVTSIGKYAFLTCRSLTAITIPGSVDSIGDYAFISCSALTDITFLGSAPPETGTGWIQSTNPGLLGHAYPTSGFPAPGGSFNGLTMGDYFYYEYTISDGQATITKFLNRAAIDLNIPSELNGCPVTAIGDMAFYNRTYLASVIIPDSVTSIGQYAFSGCALTGITIPDGVTSIGNGTFYNCSSLASANIPDSVTSIGMYAFSNSALTSITIPGSVASIGMCVFADCSNLTSVNITGGVTGIGEYMFDNCTQLSNINIPDSVTSIGMNAFFSCCSLTAITIPGNVSSIGESAFYYCSYLTDITFLGLTPTTGTNWIAYTDAGITGHAFFGAGFPAPGGSFYGLAMGDYIAPPIVDVLPSSPLTLYTQGTEATQTFEAAYNGFVESAALAVDMDEPLIFEGASSFSGSISIPLGTHTVTLTISDAAGNEAAQVWEVTVIQDKTAPAVSGILDKQKIASGSPVAVSISDDQSGVDWDSLTVYLDNKDVTQKITITENGFIIPAGILIKGEHSIKLSVSDNVGNTAEAKGDIKVK